MGRSKKENRQWRRYRNTKIRKEEIKENKAKAKKKKILKKISEMMDKEDSNICKIEFPWKKRNQNHEQKKYLTVLLKNIFLK